MTTADLDRTVLEIAAKETIVNVGGVPERTTLLGAAVFQLASMKPTNRLAAKDLLEITNASAVRAEYASRQEKQRQKERERNGGY